MHADPADPTQAADPKVIVLAIFYALVVSKMVQKGPGVSDEVVQEQQALAKALNISAWKVLYEKVPDDERLGLVDGLRRLLQCWCKLLLYPGPRCECGCEPHGVVIGCALVEGGSIRMVDPWGGRRWVVHYPLLSYWGKQFGIMPLDALASKFFDLICCVASLYPALTPTKLLVPAPVRLDAALVARAPVVRFGSAALIFDQPVNLPGRFAELGVAPERTVEISPMDFVGRVIRSMNVPEGAPPTGPLVHYTVAGLGELHLVAPADPASTQAPGSTQPIAAPQPSEPSPAAPVRSSRFGELVRKAVANRPARAPQIPPLLREFSELLTRGILDAMPLEPATDEGRGVREALSAAGIRTIADLLESRPEDLHVDVLNRANAAGLAELLDASEKATASVAKAVGDTVAKFAADRRLVTRDDLRDTALAAEFRGALTEALKGAMPEERVGEEVDRAAGLVI